MTHYSNAPGMVRVDFYKLTGKWYMTEAVDMDKHYADSSIYHAVEESIKEAFPETGERWLDQFVVVVAEPYHKNAYPILLQPEWMRELVSEEEDRRYAEVRRMAIMEKKGWLVNGEPEEGYEYEDILAWGNGAPVDVVRTPYLEEDGS